MWMLNRLSTATLFLTFFFNGVTVQASELKLQNLFQEALKNNPEILAASAGVQASEHRIPQAKVLPDPMFMIGYQNEGYSRYSLGEMSGAQWMFSWSQIFPFIGKRALRGEMAAWESENLQANLKALQLKTLAKIKEFYFDLLYAYKIREIIQEKSVLFIRMEEAALNRYTAGLASLQELSLAQTEKYMLLDKEEMANQKIQSAEGMLNTLVGRDVQSPLGRPEVPPYAPYPYRLEDLLKMAHENSPEIMFRRKMVKAAEVKVRIAEKEYFPDVTLGANLYKRTGAFEDMWSLTAQINVPLFSNQKQRLGVLEAKTVLTQNKQELLAVQNMLAANLRDSFAIVKSTERLMELYREALIPKTVQDFQLALSGYAAGKVEFLTVISILKSLLDFELLYWGQFVEREKAIARIETITGTIDFPTEEKKP